MAEPQKEHQFAQEIHSYEGQLKAYLIKSFPTLEDVDDIVQEAYARLLKAHEKKPVLEPKAMLFTSCFTI